MRRRPKTSKRARPGNTSWSRAIRFDAAGRRLLGTALAVCLASWPGTSRAALPPPPCDAAIEHDDLASRLPPRLLHAIGTVESGRYDPVARVVAPWPWAINVAGVGHVYDSPAEAVVAVRAAQAAGIRSIDVGCMQINLAQHPDAFSSLEQAFDPASNVHYAADFLLRLHASLGGWGEAVAAYHSSTPAIGAPYLRLVAAIWPISASYGVVVPAASIAPPPLRPAVAQPPQLHDDRTPAFRAELQDDAAFRRRRDAAMGLPQPGSGLVLARQSRLMLPGRDQVGRTVRANLSD